MRPAYTWRKHCVPDFDGQFRPALLLDSAHVPHRDAAAGLAPTGQFKTGK
jgi:hypothetical protein